MITVNKQYKEHNSNEWAVELPKYGNYRASPPTLYLEEKLEEKRFDMSKSQKRSERVLALINPQLSG